MIAPKVDDKILATRGNNKTTRCYMIVTSVSDDTVDASWSYPEETGFADRIASGLTYDAASGCWLAPEKLTDVLESPTR